MQSALTVNGSHYDCTSTRRVPPTTHNMQIFVRWERVVVQRAMRVLVVTCTGLDGVIRMFSPKIKTKIIVNDNEFMAPLIPIIFIVLPCYISYNNLETLILRWCIAMTPPYSNNGKAP